MFDSFASRHQKLAPLTLRAGLAIVFILFGIKKLADPSQTTSEIQLLLELDLVDAAALNFYLGLVELTVALGFLAGYKVRIFSIVSSFLVTIFFLSFLVKFGLSINPDLYRDVGLLGGSIALFILGAGTASLDEYLLKRHNSSNPQGSQEKSSTASNDKKDEGETK